VRDKRLANDRRLKCFYVDPKLITTLLNKRKITDIITVPILNLPENYEIIHTFFCYERDALGLIIYSKDFDIVPIGDVISSLYNWVENQKCTIPITSDSHCPNCFYFISPNLFPNLDKILCPNCSFKLYIINIRPNHRAFSLIASSKMMTEEEYKNWRDVTPTYVMDDGK
jgi:hypothetical protein